MSAVPLPFPTTPLSEPFWLAAAEGRFIAPRCNSCDRYFFAPEIACPHCFSTDWRWAPIGGRGEVYSFTVVHKPTTRDRPVPFVLASVDLPEGLSIFSHIVDCPPEEVVIGMKVEVAFRKQYDGRIAPVFKPV